MLHEFVAALSIASQQLHKSITKTQQIDCGGSVHAWMSIDAPAAPALEINKRRNRYASLMGKKTWATRPNLGRHGRSRRYAQTQIRRLTTSRFAQQCVQGQVY
jgi:hypothetical protein